MLQASASEDETLQSGKLIPPVKSHGRDLAAHCEKNTGEDEASAFLEGMPPNNLSKQPEKGILKKSAGIYGQVGGGGGSGAGIGGGGGSGASHHGGSSLTLPLGRMGGSSSHINKEKWSEESQSDNQEVMSVLLSPDGIRSDRLGASSLSDVERTLKSLNGYHEDILQVCKPKGSNQTWAHHAWFNLRL